MGREPALCHNIAMALRLAALLPRCAAVSWTTKRTERTVAHVKGYPPAETTFFGQAGNECPPSAVRTGAFV